MKQLTLFLVILSVAACSGGNEEAPLIEQVAKTASEPLIQKRSTTDFEPATRSQLDEFSGELMEVTVETTGASAYLYENLNSSSRPIGDVVVWRTEDDVSITLKSGVLIATRGLGQDIVSAEINAGSQDSKQVLPSQLTYNFSGGNENALALSLACTEDRRDYQTIEIAERLFETIYYVQECKNDRISISNEFWLDSKRGAVRQSRQWGGPRTGYIRTRLLK